MCARPRQGVSVMLFAWQGGSLANTPLHMLPALHAAEQKAAPQLHCKGSPQTLQIVLSELLHQPDIVESTKADAGKRPVLRQYKEFGALGAVSWGRPESISCRRVLCVAYRP